MLRIALKSGVEKTVVRSGAARLARLLRPVETVVLAYHNVLPAKEAERGLGSLHLPLEDFRRQLDVLEREFHIVSLERILDRPPRAERPRAVLTFDDAYEGAVTLGVSEIVRRGFPATIFVSPAHVGGQSFWWDELADADSGELDPDLRARALDEWYGQQDLIVRRREGAGGARRPLPSWARSASLEVLAGAESQTGITLASHSWSHRNLTRLTANELKRELSDSQNWLRRHFESVIPWLSYPYGLTTPAVQEAASAAGYQGALRIDGGVIRVGETLNCHAIQRVNVPSGVSLEGFVLRMSGLRA